MPPLQLTNLLHRTLPHLSKNGRAMLSALGCLNGRPPASNELATWLGFHDRYQFARAMRREGLPPLETLGGWARTLYWLLESETSGATLRELADREQMDPAVAYRLIRRVTGQRWSEIRREGLAIALVRFRDQCPNRAVRPSPQGGVALYPRADSRHTPLVAASVTAPPASHPPRPSRLRCTLGERVPVPGAPFDVAFTSTDGALVTRGHAAAVDVLRLGPPHVAQSIHVGPVPTRVVPSPRGSLAYVTSQFSEAIDVVDLKRGERTATLHVDGHPLGVVLAADGQTLYVSTNRDRLIALALARQAVVGDIPIPHGSPQMCLHTSGRRIYASGFRAGVIAEVEVPTLRRLRTFYVGGIVQEVAVSADGQTLYAANESGWLDVIHLPSGNRSARVQFGTAALGLAVSADQADLVVGLLHAGRVLVIDRESLAIRATLPTGGKPRLLAAQAKGLVLVANEAGWVDVLH